MLLLSMICTNQIMAQGGNTGMGGSDDPTVSLTEKIIGLEKKNDAFNVYINYAFGGQTRPEGSSWHSAFVGKQLRLEFKGNLTEKLYYRFLHRLNSNNTARSEDNFAKATDVMMVGYKLSNHWNVQAGKLCQTWGGYEFDENPIYIYRYTNFTGSIDCFVSGASVAWHPNSKHEWVLGIYNSYNDKFGIEYGNGAHTITADGRTKEMLKANVLPLTYILNWNGCLLDGKLTTKWAVGVKTIADKKYAKMITLGQKLNLKNLQWYVDYMASFEDVDHLRIVSNELKVIPDYQNNTYFENVVYHSVISKVNWQFAKQCNLMAKGAFEVAHFPIMNQQKASRHGWSYMASLEYFPIKQQDWRVFLAYNGQNHRYNNMPEKISKYNHRIELGMIARLKLY